MKCQYMRAFYGFVNTVHDFVSLSATFKVIGISAYVGIAKSSSNLTHTLEPTSILAID